jgi:hypothetical protein
VLVSGDDLADQHRAIAAAGVVKIDEKPLVDVDQEDAVLDHGRDAKHAHPRRKFDPLPVGQDRDCKSLRAQIVRDAAADMIGEQDVPAVQLLQAVAVEMVRMAVREPDVFGVQDVILAVGRNAVAQAPTAEIGGVLVAEPGIGGEDRLVVIGNEGRVARGRNANHGDLPLSFNN